MWSFPLTSWTSIHILTFGTTKTPKFWALRSCAFYLPNTGLWNAARRIRSLKLFQGPHRQSNQESPVLWCSVSTNCTTARPIYLNIKHMCNWQRLLACNFSTTNDTITLTNSNSGEKREGKFADSGLCSCMTSISLIVLSHPGNR